MNQATTVDPRSVVLEDIRVSYIAFHAPRAKPPKPNQAPSEPMYQCQVMIPKATGAENLRRCQAAMVAAKEYGEGKHGATKALWAVGTPGIKSVLRDGDDANDPKSADPNLKGHWFFNCKSKRKPDIIDSTGQRIIDPNAIYSGMQGHIKVQFYPYIEEGSKGVAAAMGNFMKTADAARLDGGTTADEDFASFINKSGAGAPTGGVGGFL